MSAAVMEGCDAVSHSSALAHRRVRIGYLGPPGTFTEEALLSQEDLARSEPVPHSSMPEVLEAIGDGTVDFGFLAIENSIGGTVHASLDGLIFDHQLLIRREVDHDIHLSLVAPKGTRLAEVRNVVSFPHALAQCRHFIRHRLSSVREVACSSTAEAVKRLRDQPDQDTAAVGTATAARRYGLEVLATDIQDCTDNQTRFVLVGPPRRGIPPATGQDKTTVVCFQHEDHPGSLHAILGEFAARGLNLTKVESRPTKRRLGDYCFVIDLCGHIDDSPVANCLSALCRRSRDLKFLGSYPTSERRQGIPGSALWLSEAAARGWISSLKSTVWRDGGVQVEPLLTLNATRRTDAERDQCT